jgi:predicted acetyltransferase
MVTLARATPDERPTVENLLQFYVYDFSEFVGASSPDFDVASEGRFALRDFGVYWSDPSHRAYLIRYGDALAGLGLINKTAVSGLPVDWRIAEFFVMRKYRRLGVGKTAALTLIAENPGLWEVPIEGYNGPAESFWRAVLGEFGPDEVPVSGTSWNGIVLRSHAPR